MIVPWPPVRFTAPLSADFPSLFGRYREAFRIAWRAAMGYTLDAWQEGLLEAITEEFPVGHVRAGELRFRQVLISVGRQCGKTEIAAALGLLFMLSRSGAYVVGIASSAEQARLVYKRAMRVIQGNRSLSRRFEALTETRGLRAKDGGQWELKAAKSAALQGLPIDLGVVDEVHLTKPELWHDLVAGTGGRPSTMVCGITTAGDEDSVLLQGLYEAGAAAIGDLASRFGFFAWEAPEARLPEDDATLLEFLRAANPALAAGRLDAGNVLSDVRSMAPTDAIRYRLNRFVAASASFIELGSWVACGRGADEVFPTGPRVVFALDRSPDWGFATITAQVLVEDVTYTEVVASIVNPTLERLVGACERLMAHAPVELVMDGYSLRELGLELKKRGLPVRITNQGEVIAASSLFYAKVARGKLRHANDPLLSVQVPRTVRKNVGESFRISRKDSSVEIDAVMATVLGVYAAEAAGQVPTSQVF